MCARNGSYGRQYRLAPPKCSRPKKPNIARTKIIATYKVMSGQTPVWPAASNRPKPPVETPNPTRPKRMTGLRPQISLRWPQNGDITTHKTAERVKIALTCTSLRPRSRAIGGNKAKNNDCPMPSDKRQTNSSDSPRVRSVFVVCLVGCSKGASCYLLLASPINISLGHGVKRRIRTTYCHHAHAPDHAPPSFQPARRS